MTSAGPDGLEVRRATDDDWAAVASLREHAFRFRGPRERLLPGMWVATERGVLVACARIQAEAQWFGGRALPTGLISSVAVAPEARGRGISRVLLRALLERARADGCVGVSLYPSALQPYRRAGFAVAGTHLTARLHLAAIRADSPLAVERLDGDFAGLTAQYGRWASATDGALARSESWWLDRMLSSDPPTPRVEPGRAVHAFVVRDGGSIVGHVIYSLREVEGEAYSAEIACRSLAWDSPGAARALLRFISNGLPLTYSMTWPASLADPVGAFIDQQPDIVASEPWMHRLIDPAGAIRGRGYPPTTRAEIDLRVVDPFVPEWSVALSIAIADGTAAVTEATRPAVAIDSAALAAVLAGGLHPFDGVRQGVLPDDPAVVDALGALAPTRRRWIGDSF